MLKKYNTLFIHVSILLVVCFIFLIPLTKGFYQSHDSVTHVVRTAAYTKALLARQLPPRWAEDLNYGYGSPFLIFYYPLPGYVMAGMHLLGIPLEMTYRLLGGLLFILGPFFFYMWTKQKFSLIVTLISTVFYISLPYRFLTFYVRGGIGEFMAFSLLPLLFYLIDSERKNISAVLLAGITLSLIILSHNAVSLLFIPVILAYAFLQDRQKAVTVSMSIALGLLLSSFFWLPALIEARYTSPLFYFANWYKDHFVSLPSLIYSPWGFGPNINKPGGLSAQLGIVGSIVLILSIVFLPKQKSEKRFTFFWLMVALLGLFLSTTISLTLWQIIDFLKKFQFPWRFMVLPAFATAALSPYIFSKIGKSWILIIIGIVCIALSLPFARVEKYVSYSDSYYYNYPGSTNFHGEATTPWTEGDPSHKASKQFEVLNGDNILFQQVKLSTVHSVITKSSLPVTLLDNTVYFPGWTAYVDKRQVPIQFQDINYKGLLEVNVPSGTHTVAFKFEETKIRLIADWISLISAIILVTTAVLFGIHKLVSKKIIY